MQLVISLSISTLQCDVSWKCFWLLLQLTCMNLTIACLYFFAICHYHFQSDLPSCTDFLGKKTVSCSCSTTGDGDMSSGSEQTLVYKVCNSIENLVFNSTGLLPDDW
jgi:hypothetical protein